MSVPRYLSDLAGTLLAGFRIGLNKFVSASGVITARDKADGNNVALAASELRVIGASYKTTLQPAASGQAADLALKLPAADGATNQAMVTDGSGNLSFITVATGANAMKSEDQVIPFGSTSPVTIAALPGGVTIQKVTVDVETAFDGAPSLSVGVVGTTSKYMAATDIDLALVAIFEVSPMIEEAGAVSPIVTYAAGGATAGSARVTVQWVLPG
jgi:hypothetical protein